MPYYFTDKQPSRKWTASRSLSVFKKFEFMPKPGPVGGPIFSCPKGSPGFRPKRSILIGHTECKANCFSLATLGKARLSRSQLGTSGGLTKSGVPCGLISRNGEV